MSQPRGRASTWLFWGAVAVMAVLHQDFWLWDDRTLLLGFLPVGLAYHASYSLIAAALWAVAIRVIWPSHIEEWADQAPDAPDSHREGS